MVLIPSPISHLENYERHRHHEFKNSNKQQLIYKIVTVCNQHDGKYEISDLVLPVMLIINRKYLAKKILFWRLHLAVQMSS